MWHDNNIELKGCWKVSHCGKEAQANIYIVLPIQFVIQQGMCFVCYGYNTCYFYICILNLTNWDLNKWFLNWNFLQTQGYYNSSIRKKYVSYESLLDCLFRLLTY